MTWCKTNLCEVANHLPDAGAGEAAQRDATRFLTSAFKGWQKDKVFYQKHDCQSVDGRRGEGGEYKPQTGFGWTNGTIIRLLQLYPDSLSSF